MRERFTVPAGLYLLSHSVGLPPATAQRALSEYHQQWAEQPHLFWPVALDRIEEFRKEVAALLGVDGPAICPQVNVSSGLSKVLSGLSPQSTRKTILFGEHDFPSTVYVVKAASTFGWEPRMVRGSNPLWVSTEDWIDQIAESVGIVFLTHVSYGTSFRLDLESIISTCRARGIITIVDVAQSIGLVPMAGQTIGADVIIGSCVKWLCGGPGAGFLYINPEVGTSCVPYDRGWFSHANPFAMDSDHFEFAPSALRLWGGTPSVLPFWVAVDSIKTIRSIGINRIWEHNQRCIAALQRLCDELPVRQISPRSSQNRGGTFVVDTEDLAGVVERLRKAGIHADYRPRYGIRLSPHVYTEEHELELVRSYLLHG